MYNIFRQISKFLAGSRSKEKKIDVATHRTGPILAGDTHLYQDEPFPIPALPPTLSDCDCIKIEYELKVKTAIFIYEQALYVNRHYIWTVIILIVVSSEVGNGLYNHSKGSGSMSLLNWEIYQRGRMSRVADMELLLLIVHLIRPPGSIPGVG